MNQENDPENSCLPQDKKIAYVKTSYKNDAQIPQDFVRLELNCKYSVFKRVEKLAHIEERP